MSSITGLTAAEVEARRAAGQTNQPPKSQTKTTGEIVRDNVCTYFNLVFLVLEEVLSTFTIHWQLGLGVALLVVVLLAPNGLLSLWRKRGGA